ncbi:MAG: TolC family protein, partial [Clostridia bacterium]|nr:TolC family protein [Clostridia bacterium]
VLDAKEKEVEAEIALEKAKWDHYASTFKMQFGTEAPIMKDIIDSDVEQKKGNLIIAQHNLNKAYTDLNILVGITPDARPVLTTEVVYEPLEITGINSEVGRAISSNVNVWAALQNVIIEKEDLRMTLKPYEIEKMEIEVAELTADGAKEELEKGLRGLYHDILSLEEAINASKGGVKAAETGLKAAEVRYDVGMATEGDLLESKATLAIAKKTQAQLKYQHATATAAYRNLTGREVLPTN